jgi:hypothetical protein
MEEEQFNLSNYYSGESQEGENAPEAPTVDRSVASSRLARELIERERRILNL